MVEVPLTADLALKIDKQWRNGSCRNDTQIIASVKVAEIGGGIMIETEHWHKSEPHQRYWRLIMRGENIVIDECTVNPVLFK